MNKVYTVISSRFDFIGKIVSHVEIFDSMAKAEKCFKKLVKEITDLYNDSDEFEVSDLNKDQEHNFDAYIGSYDGEEQFSIHIVENEVQQYLFGFVACRKRIKQSRNKKKIILISGKSLMTKKRLSYLSATKIDKPNDTNRNRKGNQIAHDLCQKEYFDFCYANYLYSPDDVKEFVKRMSVTSTVFTTS